MTATTLPRGVHMSKLDATEIKDTGRFAVNQPLHLPTQRDDSASTITWLHLSDLHAGKPSMSWDSQRVADKLVEDLETMENEHGLHPDFIFFTGDAAYGQIGKGSKETLRDQFALAQDFFEAVRGAFEPEIQRSRIFLVPGNHDVNRQEAGPDQTSWLDSIKDDYEIYRLMEQKDAQWRRYMERLLEYRSFLECSGYSHLLDNPDCLIYATTLNVAGVQVGIGGFNTAWSCCRESMDERGKLRIGSHWQLEHIHSKLKGCRITISLSHHPPNWLVESEDRVFRRGLERDFKFILHGHEHYDWVTRSADGWTQIAAGACYERSDKKNGYNWVRLDLKTGTGQVWLREYDTEGRCWDRGHVHKKTDDHGVWPLDHLTWLQDDLKPTFPLGYGRGQPPARATIPVNPFIYGRATRPEEFLNRENELRTVFGRLRNGESTAIIGEPRIGKSSLLLKLADRQTQQDYLGNEAQRLLISYLDLNPIAGDSDYDPCTFWEEALDPLWQQAPNWTLDPYRKQIKEDRYSRRALNPLFNYLGRSGRRLALLLDEFEQLLIHPNFQSLSFFGLLRSLASLTGGLMLVPASRQSIAEMNYQTQYFIETGSPFFNIMIDVKLGPFAEHSVTKLLDQASNAFSPSDRRFICSVAGRYPFLLKAMAAALLDTYGDDRYGRAAECFYERVASHFDDVWCGMDDYARTASMILSLIELRGFAWDQESACPEIERADRFGFELRNMAKGGLAEQAGEDWPFDPKRLLLWRDERWSLAVQAFAWWVRDVVVAESRSVPAYDKWLAYKRYSTLLTEEQWDQLVDSVRGTAVWVTHDARVLGRTLAEELMMREAQ